MAAMREISIVVGEFDFRGGMEFGVPDVIDDVIRPPREQTHRQQQGRGKLEAADTPVPAIQEVLGTVSAIRHGVTACETV
jgi:hypothetical protein